MRFQSFARACYPPRSISPDGAAENPAQRQTGTFYILCPRDFEILGARDVKRDEGARLIFFGRVFGFPPFKSVDDGKFSAKSFNWPSVAALVGLTRIGKVGVCSFCFTYSQNAVRHSFAILGSLIP